MAQKDSAEKFLFPQRMVRVYNSPNLKVIWEMSNNDKTGN
jgi:hypothetical protein